MYMKEILISKDFQRVPITEIALTGKAHSIEKVHIIVKAHPMREKALTTMQVLAMAAMVVIQVRQILGHHQLHDQNLHGQKLVERKVREYDISQDMRTRRPRYHNSVILHPYLTQV
jgi:hypothetical protein